VGVRARFRKEFGGDVEAAAEALDVVLVEFAPRPSVRSAKIALAAENLGDCANRGDAKLLHGAESGLRIASESHANKH